MEVEAKLILSPETQAKLLVNTSDDQVDSLFYRLQNLLAFGGYETSDSKRASNCDRYYDTPSRALFNSGNLLRVREGVVDHLLTIKKKNVGGEGIMRREEVEWTISTKDYEKSKKQGFIGELQKHFPSQSGPLSHLITIQTDRRQANFNIFRTGISLKISLDVSRSGGTALGIELEIEANNSASDSHVAIIRDVIARVFPEFEPSDTSKLTRALQNSPAKSSPQSWFKSHAFWAVIIGALITTAGTLLAKFI